MKKKTYIQPIAERIIVPVEQHLCAGTSANKLVSNTSEDSTNPDAAILDFSTGGAVSGEEHTQGSGYTRSKGWGVTDWDDADW